MTSTTTLKDRDMPNIVILNVHSSQDCETNMNVTNKEDEMAENDGKKQKTPE